MFNLIIKLSIIIMLRDKNMDYFIIYFKTKMKYESLQNKESSRVVFQLFIIFFQEVIRTIKLFLFIFLNHFLYIILQDIQYLTIFRLFPHHLLHHLHLVIKLLFFLRIFSFIFFLQKIIRAIKIDFLFS